jgi:hypothetical protein
MKGSTDGPTIILIGVTGHGKSTLAVACGAPVSIVGHGTVSTTQGYHTYELGTGEDALKIIDTQGLEDVAELGQTPQANEEISERLFSHLLLGNGTTYKAVVWCISSVRGTADLVSPNSRFSHMRCTALTWPKP